MSCICIDELRPASFRGAAFFVATDKGEYGRRDIIHEYPMRDDPYIEDMGQKATKYSVSGYLAGDDWIAQKNALVAACTARGPALLQLPTESPVMVACLTLSVSRSKDECGFYTCSMEFVVAKNFGVPAAAVGALESLVGAVFNSAVPALTQFFDTNYVANDVLQYVTDNQITRISTFAGDIITAAESSPSTDMDTSTNVVQSAIGIFQNATTYAQPGSDSALYLAQQPIPAQTIGKVATDTGVAAVSSSGITVTSGAAAIVPMIAYTINTLGNSLSPDDAIDTLTNFATWSVNEISLDELQAKINASPITPDSALISNSDASDAVNSTVFCGMVRCFALMKLAQAITAKTFATRADAIQSRANVVELFNEQIEMFQEDTIVNILLTARDYAVRSITQKMATLVPVLEINASISKPSLYWAGRLYQDVYRAEELADRNNVVSPAFMPVNFEALAR